MKPKIRDWIKVEEVECKCCKECKYKAIFYTYGNELMKIEIINPYEMDNECIILSKHEVIKILEQIINEGE